MRHSDFAAGAHEPWLQGLDKGPTPRQSIESDGRDHDRPIARQARLLT